MPDKPEVETTLIDYFVVCGYDPAVGLLEDSLSAEGDSPYDNKCRPPLQRSYTAKILNHFPQRRTEAPFSQEILPLCMPKGLRFYTEKDVPAVPSVHTFANIKEDGTRISGTAITFYEEVKDPFVCEAMANLHMEHVRELTATARERMDRDRAHVPPGTVSGGTHTLPRGRRDRTKRISYFNGGSHNVLYMTKTLCLVTRLPIVTAPRAILKTFHSIITKRENPPLPLESYIFWVLNEIPLPSPGTTLKVNLLDTSLVVQRPGLSELPLFDDSFGTLFQFLPVEKFIKLLTCFFLEHQILICSKEYSRLMCVCEAMSSLAFPFRWQMVYVPILPASQLKFVEAPVPYVMGWCYEDSVPEFLFQSNVCVLDVDSGRTEFPEDLPTFPCARELSIEIRKAIDRYSVWNEGPNGMDASTATVLPTDDVTVQRRKKNYNYLNGKQPEEWSMKRMSRSFDLEEGEDILNLSPRPSRTQLQPLPLDDVLRNNSTLSRVAEIARRVGVEVNFDYGSIENDLNTNELYSNSPVCKQYFQDAKLNNAVRECVLHRMVCMLYSYEHFVVGGQGCSDRETFEASRDSLVCFDKASFLSDQPDSHLTFLAAFLETQMFTSFIDAKILAQWEAPDDNLVLFDARIAQMRDKLGLSMVRTPTSEATPPFAKSEELITKREESLDYVVPGPHAIPGAIIPIYDGCWPELNNSLLEGCNGLSPGPSPWKQRYPRLRPRQFDSSGNNFNSHRPTSTYGGAGLLENSPSMIAQQQMKFVDQLLKETKGKTKRMLVDKMGKEAVQLGHLDAGITGVEENTLVASFCDLLERIWTHGLNKKQGKSALWTYVLQHEDLEKTGLSTRTMSSSMLTPAGLNSTTLRRPQPSVGHRAPSVPPQLPMKPPRSPSEIPNPIILPPSNENEIGFAISDICQTIQRELNTKVDPDAPAWSKNILRAANFLCDKISSAAVSTSNLSVAPTGYGSGLSARDQSREPRITTRVAPEIYGSSATLQRHRAGSQDPRWRQPAGLKKTSSLSDFTNSTWSPAENQRTFIPYTSDGLSSVEGSPRKQRSRSRARSPEGRVLLAPLPTHVAYDLKNVLRMTEIKTDIGYARAFVRLALERKLLHKHLTTLLGNSRLLSDLYKNYAFVRCEDEVEQFLYHILSLNAAQFRCFTNTFTKTKMDYQVVIVTGSWSGKLPSVWVEVEGSLTKSPQIALPPNTPLFKFDHKNLGVLSSLRIGHAPCAERPPKWFLDFVIVRNEITGQTYRFPCGRWFGKGVDDGSLERLLVAETIMEEEPTDSSNCPPGSPARGRRRTHSRSQTPQRDRSPSSGRISEQTGMNRKSRVNEIQQQLGDAVNSLVKYFLAEKQVKNELAHLLCGERGLVNAVEQAFQFGRQESTWTRMFRQHYPWDYIERTCQWFNELYRRGELGKLKRSHQQLILYSLDMLRRISEKPQLGKDGRFHVFVLLTVRDHQLSGFLQLMALTPITKEMYSEPSFLRTPSYLSFLSKLLDSLNEFTYSLDRSLTYDIV